MGKPIIIMPMVEHIAMFDEPKKAFLEDHFPKNNIIVKHQQNQSKR